MNELREDSPSAEWQYELRARLPQPQVSLLDDCDYKEYLMLYWTHCEEIPFEELEKSPLLHKRFKSSNAFNLYMRYMGKRSVLNSRYRGSGMDSLPEPHKHEGSRTSPFSIDVTLDPPFLAGLRHILSQQLNKYHELLIQAIMNWVPPKQDWLIARSRSTMGQKSEQSLDDATLSFEFAPSGSGKTTSIFSKLIDQYGYYMVASALGSEIPDSNAQQQNILDPKNLRGVSKDTQELLKILKHIEKLEVSSKLGLSSIPSVCKIWWSSILVERSFVHTAFQKAKTGQARIGKARTGKAKTRKAKTRKAKTRKAKTRKAKTRKAKTRKAKRRKAKSLKAMSAKPTPEM